MADAPAHASWTVRKFASNAEADRHDLEFWAAMTPDERVNEVWRLSLAQYRLAGCPACQGPDEPRLDRTAVRIFRR